MTTELASIRRLFISTHHVGRLEIRWALAAMGVTALFFLVAIPFASAPLARVPAFIPLYESAPRSILLDSAPRRGSFLHRQPPST
jgi:hypothetical protein